MQPLGCSTVHAPVVDGTGRRLVSAGDAPIHKHDMSVTYDGPSWVSVLDQNSTRHARPCWGSPRLLRCSLSSCRTCRNCKCFCPPHFLKRRPHVLHFNSRPADFGGFKRGRPSSSSRSTASWATTHSLGRRKKLCPVISRRTGRQAARPWTRAKKVNLPTTAGNNWRSGRPRHQSETRGRPPLDPKDSQDTFSACHTKWGGT